jgi:hypothetical protein
MQPVTQQSVDQEGGLLDPAMVTLPDEELSLPSRSMSSNSINFHNSRTAFDFNRHGAGI